MKMNIKTLALVAAASLLPFAGCKKNSTADSLTSDDQTAALDQAQLERTSNDAESVADNAANYGAVNLRVAPDDLSSCASVSIDTVSTPHVVTINFGSTNCLGADGNYRRGEIIVTYSGVYKDSGSIHTISYNNYYFNNNQLKGGKTVINKGKNSSGNYYYEISVNDTLITDSGATVTWSGTRTRVWTAGYSTASRLDDEYDISGSTTVVRPSGRSTTFSVSSSTPLHVALNCKWVESGELTATRSTGGSYTINYGSGACDRLATITIGSKTYNITLR